MSGTKRNSRRSRSQNANRATRQFDPRSVFPKVPKVELPEEATLSTALPLEPSIESDGLEGPYPESALSDDRDLKLYAVEANTENQLEFTPATIAGTPVSQGLEADPRDLNPDLLLSDAPNVTILQGNFLYSHFDSSFDLSSSGEPSMAMSDSSIQSQTDQADLNDREHSLLERLEKAVHQRQTLEADMIKMETEIQANHKTQEQLQAEIKALQKQLAQAEQKVLKRQQQLDKQRSEAETQQETLEQVLKERDQLIEELRQQLNHYQTLDQSAQNHSQQIEQLQQQVDHYQTIEQSVSERDQQIETLQQQLNHYQELEQLVKARDQQIELLQACLVDLEQKPEVPPEIEHELTVLKQEHQDYQVQISDLEAQVVARQKLNERQRQDIDYLQDQLEQQKLAMAQERRQWEHQQQDLQVALVEAQDLAQKRIDMLQRFKAELSLARTQATEAETELNHLKHHFAEQESLWREHNDSLEARLAGYAETEAETEQRWHEEQAELQHTLAELKDQLSSYQQLLEDREQQHHNQLHQWDTERQRLLQQVEQTKTELTLQRQHYEALQEYQEQLQAKLVQLESKVPDLETQLSEYQTLLPDLLATQQQLKDLEQERDHYKETLSLQHREIEVHTASATELSAEVRYLRDKIAEQQQHNLRLKAALERAVSRDRVNSNTHSTPRTKPPQSLTVTDPAQKEGPLSHAIHSRRARDQGIDLPNFLRS